jgi:hypothetical protein
MCNDHTALLPCDHYKSEFEPCARYPTRTHIDLHYNQCPDLCGDNKECTDPNCSPEYRARVAEEKKRKKRGEKEADREEDEKRAREWEEEMKEMVRKEMARWIVEDMEKMIM